jgi:hypothetical protein
MSLYDPGREGVTIYKVVVNHLLDVTMKWPFHNYASQKPKRCTIDRKSPRR